MSTTASAAHLAGIAPAATCPRWWPAHGQRRRHRPVEHVRAVSDQ